MTLQEKKEQLAEKANGYTVYGKGYEKAVAFNDGFVSGFDAADAIGLLEFAVLNNYFCNDSNKDRITWSRGAATENITTEELYLRFIEYKQTLKH